MSSNEDEEKSSSEGESESESEEEEEEEEVSDDGGTSGEDKDRKRIRGKAKVHSKRGSKRAKTRSGAAAFFEEEVEEVNEESEEEEEEEEGFRDATPLELSKHERETQERYEARMKANESFSRRSAEDIASEIEKRHRVSAAARWTAGDDEEVDLSRSSNLPTVNDPKLFCVKCKPGEERLLVVRIMNKYLAMKNENRHPRIYSCISPGTKGFIYIEARSEGPVRQALEGLRGVFRKLTLVPLGQMSTVMNISSSKQAIKPGDFVRLRTYPYRGDLGKIFHVLESGTRVVVQCVPRLDFQSFGMNKDERTERKKERIVSPKRFFNSEEVANAGGRPERQTFPHTGKMIDFFDGNYFENGYLLKEFNIRAIQTKDVAPTVEELQSFRLGRSIGDEEEEDAEAALEDGALLDQLGSSLSRDATGISFKKNDVVVVKEGELEHLKGHVVGVEGDGNTIKVRPIHEDIRDQVLEFPASQLMKYFQVGNHVKVLGGRYAGETGTVVKVEETGEKWKAILFADSAMKEIQVFVHDLQLSEEISVGKDSLSGFSMYDVVVLGQGQVGMITKVGNEGFRVLLQNNTVKSISLSDIRNKIHTKRAGTALDRLKNPIRVNDVVKISSGENAGVEGTVKHIHRSLLFVYSRQRIQNAGVIVERARNCQLSGETVKKHMMVEGRTGGSRSDRINFGRGRGRARDTLPGKTVKIKQGRFKGYIGIVTSATPDVARVEIHSKNKTITIERNKVFVVGDMNAESKSGGNSSSRVLIGSSIGNSVPYQPLATPMHAPGTPGGFSNSSGAWDPKSSMPASIPTPAAPEIDKHEPTTPSDLDTTSIKYPTPKTPVTPATPAISAEGSSKTNSGFDFSQNMFNEGDDIKVVNGEHQGKKGKVQGVDNQEAIVILDEGGNEVLKILPITNIQKL